jgi:hypothetical protein
MPEDVSIVPSWEVSAKIFITNLMCGTNPVVQESSKEALLAMARALDKIQDKMTEVEKYGLN